MTHYTQKNEENEIRKLLSVCKPSKKTSKATFQQYQMKNWQPRIPYPVKISLKNDSIVYFRNADIERIHQQVYTSKNIK